MEDNRKLIGSPKPEMLIWQIKPEIVLSQELRRQKQCFTDRTVRSKIGYWHDTVVCPSVRLSVAKRHII